MSEIKVNSIKGVGASTAAISIDNSSGTCTANITNNLSNRNLIINGAMQVAQRGTSSTTIGYQTVDRFSMSFGGEDEDPTQAQVDLSSSDTPYSSGFRKAFKITNGNQTSTGGSDFMALLYKIEAQDIANSGWNYTDLNSKLTIQFWAKSSVAKTFIISFYAADGTPQQYNHKYTLAANTWTKVTHTISGSSTLVFDNNNATGLNIEIFQYIGTNLTSGSTVDQWVTYVGSSSTPDDTDDWWTTNDATFEITGVQLEVGSVATDFEHRSFGQELSLCQRYFETGNGLLLAAYSGGAFGGGITLNEFAVTKRATPTITVTQGSGLGSQTASNVNTNTTYNVGVHWSGSATAGDYRAFTFTASAEL